MKRTYSGAATGKGGAGNKEIGEGRMEIIESAPPSTITIKMAFIKPLAAQNTVEFTFDHVSTKTTFQNEETMRHLQLTLAGLSVVLVASVAVAKEKKAEKPMDPQAMMEVYAKLATPGEPHRQLASLVGSWITKTKEWMERNKPPIESTGSAEMKMLLDGRFLQQEFTGDMMGQPYSGVGITAYDNLRRRYVSTWIDTMSTGIFMMEGTGSADGKTIALKGQHPEPGGGYMTHRAVWKIVDSNTQTFDMYGTHHGGKEMKMMEITYTRKQ